MAMASASAPPETNDAHLSWQVTSTAEPVQLFPDADTLFWSEDELAQVEAHANGEKPRAAHGARSASAELNAHTFDAIVRENLGRGLLLTQRDVLINATRDPRLARRHRLALASLIEHTNTNSGTAYPGWRALADATSWYDHEWVVRHYTQDGIGKTISELVEFGYLAAIRRAPVGGGRALSHYTIVKPSSEELRAQISHYILKIRQQQYSTKAQSGFRADPTPVGSVSDPTFLGSVSGSDPTPPGGVRPADPTPVVPTGTRREGTRREEGVADAPADAFSTSAMQDGGDAKYRQRTAIRQEARTAFALYRESAQRCGLAAPEHAEP
jgi:hypothetical protein